MLINFFCNQCKKSKPKLLDQYPTKDDKYYCSACNYVLDRVYEGMSANTIENVDNGFAFKTVDYDAQRAEMHRNAGDDILKKLTGD